MVDVRGDVLRPPHGTTPAAVKTNKVSAFVHQKGTGAASMIYRCLAIIVSIESYVKHTAKQNLGFLGKTHNGELNYFTFIFSSGYGSKYPIGINIAPLIYL